MRVWALCGRGAVIALVAASLPLVAGCSKGAKDAAEAARVAADAQDGKFTVRDGKGGSVQVETEKQGGDSGKVTATTKDGTVTSEYGKDKVTEQDVGVAFYPGATVEQGNKYAATGKDAAQAATVTLVTKDSFDKVAKFYKAKYGKGNTVVEQPNNLMIGLKGGKDQGKMLMVQVADGQTKITITATAKP